MYQTIVVPLDGSSWSEQALPVACEIARRSHAQVHLVRVYVPIVEVRLGGNVLADVPIVDKAWNDELRQKERDYLHSKATGLANNADVQVSSHLLDGPVAATLAGYIEESAADLVVLTTHGRGGLVRAWLGSVVDSLVRHSRAPLLVVRPHDGSTEEIVLPSPSRILIPLDGSAWAEQVIAPAVALGNLFGAECTLLQVIEPLHARGYVPGVDLLELAAEGTKSLCVAARKYLDGVASRVQESGMPVTVRVIPSDYTPRTILEDAEARSIDLIAMATHSRGNVARLFLGSVSDKVLRGAEVPVLIFRPTGDVNTEPSETSSAQSETAI